MKKSNSITKIYSRNIIFKIKCNLQCIYLQDHSGQVSKFDKLIAK